MVSAAFPVVGRAMETALMLQKFCVNRSKRRRAVRLFGFVFNKVQTDRHTRVTWELTGLEDGIVTKESECVLSSGHCPFHLNLLTLIETLILEFVDAGHANLEDPERYWLDRSAMKAINRNKRHIIINLKMLSKTITLYTQVAGGHGVALI